MIDGRLEDVQRYWDRQPCNIKHGEAKLGTPEYYRQVSEKRYLAEPHILNFADFGVWDKKNVLEVGCGIGTDASEFARNGANYTGVELSGESLSIAAKRFELEGLEGRLGIANAETLESDLRSLGFDNHFDLIYSFGVLHHTPDIAKALNEIKSLADPETEIRVMVYAENSLKNALIGIDQEQPEAQSGCPIANTYTRHEITELFHESGLAITELVQDHIFQWQLEDYKRGRFTKLPWFESMPKPVYDALASVAGWHLLIKAKLIEI